MVRIPSVSFDYLCIFLVLLGHLFFRLDLQLQVERQSPASFGRQPYPVARLPFAFIEHLLHEALRDQVGYQGVCAGFILLDMSC
jgi:hypothetical protein